MLARYENVPASLSDKGIVEYQQKLRDDFENMRSINREPQCGYQIDGHWLLAEDRIVDEIFATDGRMTPTARNQAILSEAEQERIGRLLAQSTTENQRGNLYLFFKSYIGTFQQGRHCQNLRHSMTILSLIGETDFYFIVDPMGLTRQKRRGLRW